MMDQSTSAKKTEKSLSSMSNRNTGKMALHDREFLDALLNVTSSSESLDSSALEVTSATA